MIQKRKRYTMHPTQPWLAAIDVEHYPEIDPDTDEGKEDLAVYASLIMYETKTVQHVLIRRGGKVIGEIADAGKGDGFGSGPTLH
jgi:hypothetical protein